MRTIAKNSTKRLFTIGAMMWISILSNMNADVTPVVIALGGSTSGTSRPTSYTVPAGKTLVLQHIANETALQPILTLTVGANTSTLRVKSIGSTVGTGADNLGFEAFDRQVNLPAGATVSLLATSVITLFGMLADAGDLYVSTGSPVQTTIQSVASTGSNMTLETKIHPPKPANLTVARSTDLTTFTEDPTAQVASVSSSRKDVTVNTGSEEMLFVKVKGRARTD